MPIALGYSTAATRSLAATFVSLGVAYGIWYSYSVFLEAATRTWDNPGMRYLYGALLAIALSTGPALAHHGWSGYDSDKTLNLTGTIREAGYEHPHGYMKLEVPGKTWLVVLAPPSRMENRGLARDALKPGKTATVVGYPNRTDPNELRAERITLDGKTTELR